MRRLTVSAMKNGTDSRTALGAGASGCQAD